MQTKTVEGTVLTPQSILAIKDVQTGMVAAWNLTVRDKVDYGGGNFFSAKGDTYRSNQKKGDALSVGSTPAPACKAGERFVIVADWHFHPGTDVAASRPSKEDMSNAKSKSYFMLVMTSKKDPTKGWPEALLKEIEVVETKDAYRIWNII